LQAITKLLRDKKRGISTVIVVMLSLVLIVTIVGNVILWSYQMNQVDWEKMQEKIEIISMQSVNETWTQNPSGFDLVGLTTLASGNLSNLWESDGSNMTFQSYFSGTDNSDFVDVNTSDVDLFPNVGLHSNFSALQEKPDSIYDTLTEFREISSFGDMKYRKNFTINHNYVDGDQSDFPVLIDLYDRDLHDDVQNDGDDIVFLDAFGNNLNHEIEFFDKSYNSTHAHLIAWVKVDLSGDVDVIVSMLYGNSTIGNQQDPPEVWDDNYLGVWHMNSDASDSSLPYYDGVAVGSPSDVVGVIGGAQNFNSGNPDRYDTGTIFHGIGSGDFMMEAWVNRDIDTGQSYQGIISNGNYDPAMYVEVGGSIRWGGYWSGNLMSDSETVNDVWYYYVMKRESSVIYFYKDGVVQDSTYANSRNMANAIFRFGSSSSSFANHMDGIIDEVRFSDVTRTAGWINTNYQNVVNNSAFISSGSEEIDAGDSDYDLDLELQWNNLDHNETYEELCIFCEEMDGENLALDVWSGSNWENLISDLNPGWNNVSISPYLDSSTLTIRFKDSIEFGDLNSDSWNIDAVLLHLWTIEHTSAIEFLDHSNNEEWSQLKWNSDISWTIGSVDVTIQLYNFSSNKYSTSGAGYLTYISNNIPNVKENKTQTITLDSTDYRNETGYWKLKITGITTSDSSFLSSIDWIQIKETSFGALITFQNGGSLTSHVVSLWINNSTSHQRFEIDLFIASGETTSKLFGNIILPAGSYTTKASTERGNLAILSA